MTELTEGRTARRQSPSNGIPVSPELKGDLNPQPDISDAPDDTGSPDRPPAPNSGSGLTPPVKSPDASEATGATRQPAGPPDPQKSSDNQPQKASKAPARQGPAEGPPKAQKSLSSDSKSSYGTWLWSALTIPPCILAVFGMFCCSDASESGGWGMSTSDSSWSRPTFYQCCVGTVALVGAWFGWKHWQDSESSFAEDVTGVVVRSLKFNKSKSVWPEMAGWLWVVLGAGALLGLGVAFMIYYFSAAAPLMLAAEEGCHSTSYERLS